MFFFVMPSLQRLLARAGSSFLALADVGGEGHDFAAVGVLQPFQDDGGVEAAGVGEHDFPGCATVGEVPRASVPERCGRSADMRALSIRSVDLQSELLDHRRPLVAPRR